MITIKDPKAKTLFDCWSYLGPKRRKMLGDSWSGIFRSEILPILPVDKLIAEYISDFGRPSKELYTSLGVLLLQQMHDFTDTETVHQFAFNLQWHYALNITDDSDACSYMCGKTLWSFRKLVMDKELDSELFACITGKLSELFSVNTDNQRLDSVHIRSNMKNLGCIGLFASTIRKFIVNLKRHHRDLFASLASHLIDTYYSKASLSVFSMVKPSESLQSLKKVSHDMLELYNYFSGNAAIENMSSYKLLGRVLQERCKISSDNQEEIEEITLKAGKEIRGSSLQNPSDPTAGYNAHKGQGYEGQVMETYSVGNDEDSDNIEETQSRAKLNLITYVNVAPSNHSDADALIPAIENTQSRGLGAETILVDSLYGSDDNLKEANERKVKVTAPAMGYKEKHAIKLSDFEMSKGYERIICPMGKKAHRIKLAKERINVGFMIEDCSRCSRLNDCPVKAGANYYYLRCALQAIRTSHRRKFEDTVEFKERYRMRSGIEGAISEFDRRTGIKHLRVRGLVAVRFCMNLKAAGLNIFRSASFRKLKLSEILKNGTKKASELTGDILFFLYAEIFSIISPKTTIRARFREIVCF